MVAVFLTINDELPNTELEKIGEVLPRIEVLLIRGLQLLLTPIVHQMKGEHPLLKPTYTRPEKTSVGNPNFLPRLAETKQNQQFLEKSGW